MTFCRGYVFKRIRFIDNYRINSKFTEFSLIDYQPAMFWIIGAKQLPETMILRGLLLHIYTTRAHQVYNPKREAHLVNHALTDRQQMKIQTKLKIRLVPVV